MAREGFDFLAIADRQHMSVGVRVDGCDLCNRVSSIPGKTSFFLNVRVPLQHCCILQRLGIAVLRLRNNLQHPHLSDPNSNTTATAADADG